MAGSSLRGRRLLVLALLLGLGLAGAVGYQVWKRRQPIRPFATFHLSSAWGMTFLDESTIVAFLRSEEPGVVIGRVYSVEGGTAALVTESSFWIPGDRFPVVSVGPRALSVPWDNEVLRVRSLPTFEELRSIKLDRDRRTHRVVPLSERLVAVVYTDRDREHRPDQVPTLLDVYDVQKGSLVGKVDRQEIAARIAPSNVYLEEDQGPYFDRGRGTLHLLLEGGIWIEWSLAEKRTTRVRRLPFFGYGFGLSSEGELLFARALGRPLLGWEALGFPPDEKDAPRPIAPGLSTVVFSSGDFALVSPSGNRIVVRAKEPEGSVYAVDVGTKRRWRLVPRAVPAVLTYGAFSPSGERVALFSARANEDEVYWVELFQLPP
jgi:hypothetical protein